MISLRYRNLERCCSSHSQRTCRHQYDSWSVDCSCNKISRMRIALTSNGHNALQQHINFLCRIV